MKNRSLLLTPLFLFATALAQVPADKVAMPVDKLQALKARLVKAAAQDSGFQLDVRASDLSRLKKRGNDVVARLDCAQQTVARGHRYKGLFLPQPWDSQLLGKASLTYDVVVVGGDPEKGELKALNRQLTMEDQTCKQTWSFNFDSKRWELWDPTTKELKDAVEVGKESPCHLHVDPVPIYDNRTGTLYFENGRVRNSRYTTVSRKYLTSREEFERIRELWLDQKIFTKNGEIIEIKPPDDPK